MKTTLFSLALLGCSPSVDPRSVDPPEALAVVSSTCSALRLTCVEHDEPQPPYVKDGLVSVSLGWCSRDADLCEFAVAHEAWHVVADTGLRGSEAWHVVVDPELRGNERLADCFAVSVSSLAASRAALEWFAGRHPLELDSSHGSGPQRAAIVRACLGPGAR